MPAEESYGGKVAVGAFFMVATRFLVRLLGLISVTILARVLTPEDFGVFGTAALVLSFFVLMKEIGFGEAVVKTQNLQKADIDTLWTMRFILALITSGLLVALTIPIANFLQEPRIIEVLYALALVPIIDSFYSPASAVMLKEFKYVQNFLLRSVDKLVRVIVVVIFALTLQSYWALVFGALIATVLSVVVSQIAQPYVPRLTLSRLEKFKSFALWTYWRGVARFIATSADEFVVRASVSTALFGIYHVARDLSRVLIIELISPLGEAFLPALVKMSGDIERFANAVKSIVGVYLIAGAAIATGIILTSDEIVLLLLGAQWKQASYFLALIAVGAVCNAVGDVNQNIFIAKNVPRYGAIFWTVRAISYSICCLTAGLLWGVGGVAIAFTASSAVILLIEVSFLFVLVKCRLSWLWLLGRPAIATLGMVLAVEALPAVISPELWLHTFIKVGVGAITYIGILAGIWFVSGKPQGPEYLLIERLPKRLRRLILGNEP